MSGSQRNIGHLVFLKHECVVTKGNVGGYRYRNPVFGSVAMPLYRCRLPAFDQDPRYLKTFSIVETVIISTGPKGFAMRVGFGLVSGFKPLGCLLDILVLFPEGNH